MDVAWYTRSDWIGAELLRRQVLCGQVFHASCVRSDLLTEIFHLKAWSSELFNKMPDIGSSQNVQAVEVPGLNGNIGQNGVKSPNQEVSKMLKILDHCGVLMCPETIVQNIKLLRISEGACKFRLSSV